MTPVPASAAWQAGVAGIATAGRRDRELTPDVRLRLVAASVGG
jgi:hypothetical protein